MVVGANRAVLLHRSPLRRAPVRLGPSTRRFVNLGCRSCGVLSSSAGAPAPAFAGLCCRAPFRCLPPESSSAAWVGPTFTTACWLLSLFVDGRDGSYVGNQNSLTDRRYRSWQSAEQQLKQLLKVTDGSQAVHNSNHRQSAEELFKPSARRVLGAQAGESRRGSNHRRKHRHGRPLV